MLPRMSSDHMAHSVKASKQAMLLFLQPVQHMVMQLLFAEEDLTQWQWYRSACQQTSTTAATHLQGRDATGDDKADHPEGFETIPGAVKRLYVPSQDDIHHSLRVQCKPASRWVIIAIGTLHCTADFITC